MSILIKGMEMPKGGYRILEIGFDADGHPIAICDDKNVYDVISIPPHGRLIEENKVLDIVSAWCPDDDWSVGKVGDLREMLDEIEALPNIIPAEEDE